MSFLNLISLLGMFGLCAIAWLFSENRSLKVFPWRVVLMGILLQLVLGALVFWFPVTRWALQVFSGLLDGVFLAADTGASFVFGKNLVPLPSKPADINLGYIFAFRALPTVIFFARNPAHGQRNFRFGYKDLRQHKTRRNCNNRR
jgi:CNT family concentrative nucleoside transporter